MAEITSFTAAKQEEMVQLTMVDGDISGDDLTLTRLDTTTATFLNLGGPVGHDGPIGEISEAQMIAAIDAAHADGAILSSMLATGTIVEANILNDAVTNEKLVDGAVTSAKIADGAITYQKLLSLSVTEEKFAAGAVTAPKFAPGAVTSAKLAAPSGGVSNSVRYYKLGKLVTVYTEATGFTGGMPFGVSVTLPVGYRPAATVTGLCSMTSYAWPCRVMISSAGVITFSPTTDQGRRCFSLSFIVA